jgi:polyketide synthase PksN
MGHAGNAAGIVGVLKLLLSLKHRQIPPSLHFQKGNPAIDFESSPFYVNTQLKEWMAGDGQVRRAAVSSFGFSGANAHLVIEEAPSIDRATVEAPGYLVALSARTSGQLKQQAHNLLALVKRTPDLSLNDLSFSLFVGRAHLTHRLSCVVRNPKELIHLLERWVETGTASQIYTSDIQEGRMREHGALKRLGNYCIQECRNATNDDNYLENLAAVADLYAQGYPLDFHALFSSDSRRMPLPTYPFARERYWVDAPHAAAPRSTAVASAQVDDAATEVPIEPAWVFSTQPPSAAGDDAAQIVSMGPEEKMTLFLKQEAAIQLRRPVDGIPTDLSYFDMGLSSLAITNLVKNTNRLLDENLSPRALFEYSDIRSLAAYLAATYPSKICALTAIRRTGPQAHPGERSHGLSNGSWQQESLDDGYERLTF